MNSKQESFRRKEDRKIGREEEKAMDTVRMGIVGFGNMGTGHAGNIAAGKIDHMVLAGIADISQER